MNLTLSEETKKSLEEKTGLAFEQILSMDSEDLLNKVEKNTGKKIVFRPVTDSRFLLMMRGSMYLIFGRFFEFDRKKMNKSLDGIVKRKFKLT